MLVDPERVMRVRVLPDTVTNCACVTESPVLTEPPFPPVPPEPPLPAEAEPAPPYVCELFVVPVPPEPPEAPLDPVEELSPVRAATFTLFPADAWPLLVTAMLLLVVGVLVYENDVSLLLLVLFQVWSWRYAFIAFWNELWELELAPTELFEELEPLWLEEDEEPPLDEVELLFTPS